MIITKAHGFTSLKGIECAENGGVAETLGDTACIEWVKSFRGGEMTSVHENSFD
jgi:hypothetical protein